MMRTKIWFGAALLVLLAGLLAGLAVLDEGGWPLALLALLLLAGLAALSWGARQTDEIDRGGTGSTDGTP